MLGNLQEIVFDPFRLNSHGSLHGQYGGFVTKGGSCRTPLEQMATGMRVEQPHFSNSGEFRPVATGFRIVLSAAIQTSAERIAKLDGDWEDKQATRTGSDPATDLIRISEQKKYDKEREELERVAAEVRAELAERKRIESRSIRSALRSGASHLRMLRKESNDVERVIKSCELAPDTAKCAEVISNFIQRRDWSRSIYSEILVQIGEDFTLDEIKGQSDIVAAGFASAAPHLELFVDLFLDHVESFILDPNHDMSERIDELLAIPELGKVEVK